MAVRGILFLILSLSLTIGLFSLYTLVVPDQKARTCESPAPIAEFEMSSRSTFLLILVVSSPNDVWRRTTIRETWMKKYKKRTSDVLIRFSIGTLGLSPQEMRNISSEDTAHGDLLLLPHLHDSYKALTRKVLHSFVVVTDHYSFSYLLKCDLDTFVVLDSVLRELMQRRSNQSYYWGYHYKFPTVRKKGKWAENEWFLCETYFSYAAGGGYVLSQDLVRRIASSSDDLVLYNNEDASVGAWLSPYSIERHHDERLNTHPLSFSKCNDDQFMLAERNITEMFAMQRSLDKRRRLCSYYSSTAQD